MLLTKFNLSKKSSAYNRVGLPPTNCTFWKFIDYNNWWITSLKIDLVGVCNQYNFEVIPSGNAYLIIFLLTVMLIFSKKSLDLSKTHCIYFRSCHWNPYIRFGLPSAQWNSGEFFPWSDVILGRCLGVSSINKARCLHIPWYEETCYGSKSTTIGVYGVSNVRTGPWTMRFFLFDSMLLVLSNI